MFIPVGFSGVYFEKVLKVVDNPHDFDIWDRNIQLALYSLIFAFLGLYMDGDIIIEKGFFADFNWRTMGIISLMSGGATSWRYECFAMNIADELQDIDVNDNHCAPTWIGVFYCRFQCADCISPGKVGTHINDDRRSHSGMMHRSCSVFP